MEAIYYNGKIITMEEKNKEDSVTNAPEAVMVKDGIIFRIGKLSELEKLAGDDVIRIDLNGKCLMPAFIDAHSHFVMNGQMSVCADLSECESFSDIVNVLKGYIIENKISKENAVIGFGYDHNFLKEESQPDKRVLDEVSKEIPILILHISGHLACANSAAISIAGIHADSPNPDGGVIGRMADGKEPSGYFEEAGMALVQKAMAPRIQVDTAKMMQNIQSIYVQNGITTAQDGASTENDIRMMLALGDAKQLKIDVVAYPMLTGGSHIMEEYEEKYGNYHNHLKIGGYKLILDGSPQGRSAWLSSPYLGGEKDYCGYPWMKDEQVEKLVKLAVSENKQVLAHCNGDAASEQYLNAYEKAVKETGNSKELRPVMIHCQTVRNDQLERMAKLHMIASVFVGHVWYWGDIHLKNLGEERGNHISPVKDALDRGVVVNFHQDTPVTKPNMLHSVWCAVNRMSRNGRKIGEGQAISVYEALKAVTVNAAYQYFEEKSKGTISVGKRADLVILDQSPLEVEAMDIKDIHVIETIKDGETIFKR